MNQSRNNFDGSELAARLSSVEHFRHLPLEQVQAVVASGSIYSYPKDAVIFVENDPGTSLYVLLSGQVQLAKLSADGQTAILAVFDPVIMFNEVPALDRGPAHPGRCHQPGPPGADQSHAGSKQVRLSESKSAGSKPAGAF